MEKTISSAIKNHNLMVHAKGGFLEINESDNDVNNSTRQILSNYYNSYPSVYVGLINICDSEKRQKILNHQMSPLEKYNGEFMCNFGCDFIIPIDNDDLFKELESALIGWNETSELKYMNEIFNIIESNDGYSTIWY